MNAILGSALAETRTFPAQVPARYSNQIEINPALTEAIDLESFTSIAVPMPELSAVPNGYDAIAQFRADVLRTVFASELGNRGAAGFTSQLATDPRDYGTAFNTAADAAVAATERELGARYGRDFDLSARSVHLRVSRPSVVLSPPDANEVGLEWTAELYVETDDESPIQGEGSFVDRDLLGRMAGLSRGEFESVVGPKEPTVALARGAVALDAPLGVDRTPDQFRAHATVDLSRGSERRELGTLADHPYDAAREAVSDALDDALALFRRAGRVRLSPVLSLAGARSGAGLGLERFTVERAVTLGNRAGIASSVLSLCVEATDGAGGDPSGVVPFVGQQSFAYYVSEPVVRSVAEDAWSALGPGTRSFVQDVPIDIEQNGSERTVLGQISVSFDTLESVGFDAGSGDYPDPVVLSGQTTTTMQRLWNDTNKNDEVEDLGRLAEPDVDDYVWHALPFLVHEPFGRTNTPAIRTLKVLHEHLMNAVYMPIDGRWRNTAIRGETSAPLGGVFLHGDLNRRYA
jgi:hypothetical protein